MEVLFSLIAVGVLAYLVSKLVSRLLRKTIVYEYQSGMKYVDGKYQGVLSAGSYWHNALTTKIETIDTRPLNQTIPSQEVLSQDGIAIKISLVATTKVIDVESAIHETQDYLAAVYLELQQALRMLVSDKSIDQLMQSRQLIGDAVQTMASKKTQAIGVDISSVGIKDMTFPGSLKQTFAQVVSARQEGLAALERARGESAALRSLANSAKLLENNPSLLRLRTLQALNETSGNTIVLKLAHDES